MLHDQKGIALVLTIMAVSFMAAVTVYLLSTVNWQMQASVNLRDSIVLDAANRSGLSIARAALEADRQENRSDSIHDSWHSLEQEKLSRLLEVSELEVTVTDLSGLLQVNALLKPGGPPDPQQRNLWVRFLTSGQFGDMEQSEANDLVDAIIDWIDENDLVTGNGAESGYYLSRSPSYEPRNGPLLHADELLLIKGMTTELFYGNDEHSGIGRFITSVSGTDGRVNINTAPPEVLLALAENMDADMVRVLIEFRENEDNQDMLENPAWYKNILGIIDIPQEILTVSSSYFRIRSTARNAGVTRTGEAVLQRLDQGGQNLLSWEVR